MGKTKIAITMDAEFVGELDRLVEENYFQNRSQAIRDAVREKLAGIRSAVGYLLNVQKSIRNLKKLWRKKD